jgi:hypothetical protein
MIHGHFLLPFGPDIGKSWKLHRNKERRRTYHIGLANRVKFNKEVTENPYRRA